MSEIHYVNRVDQSPFQKLEADKIAESESTQPDPTPAALEQLEKAKAFIPLIMENPAVQEELAERGLELDPQSFKVEYHVPDHVGETVVLQPYQHVEPNSQTSIRCSGGADLEKLLEEPDDNIGNVDTDIASTSTPDPTLILLSQLLKENLAEVEFKRQVISAFKHLGLDTRKHFGV